MNSELKTQIEDGLAKVSSQVDSRFNTLKERMDGFEKKAGRVGSEYSGKTFKSVLTDGLYGVKDDLSRMKAGQLAEVRMTLKDAGDMTTGNSYTGNVIQPDKLSGVHFDPDRPNHVRQFIPQAPTTSNSVEYTVETGYTDGTAGQVEGQTKGQSDFDIEAKSAPVETRASFIRVSKQMLDDTPFLAQYINQRMPKKLFLDEDNQILYGDGNSPNIEGITEVAQAYTNVLVGTNITNRWDVLANAIAQARTESGEYTADRILLNPLDWWNLVTEKDENGRYLMPESVRAGATPFRIGGVQIVPITAVASDDFIVGDFLMGATMAMREGINLRFFEQDADNVTTNKVTVRVEERYALPIHNPSAFVYGDFTGALAS